ncbi:hypothetical protein D3C81_1004610 [compost metagenome]
MELALPHMHEPQLKLAAAEAHLKLKRPAQARALVLQALETTPKLEQAETLLRRIDG